MFPLKWVSKLNYQKKYLNFDKYDIVYYENILTKTKKDAKTTIIISSLGDDENKAKKLANRIKKSGDIFIVCLINNIQSTLKNRDQKITYKLLVASFKEFIIEKTLTNIRIISLSSGSIIATLLAEQCREINALFLISPLTPDNIIDSSAVLMHDKKDVRIFVENRLYYKINQIHSSLEVRNLMRTKLKYNDYYLQLFSDLTHHIHEKHWEHSLRKIKVPVTIIRGVKDPISTAYDVQILKNNLSNSPAVIIRTINHARHNVYDEQIHKIVKIINE